MLNHIIEIEEGRVNGEDFIVRFCPRCGLKLGNSYECPRCKSKEFSDQYEYYRRNRKNDRVDVKP